jgi:hypothetical protein
VSGQRGRKISVFDFNDASRYGWLDSPLTIHPLSDSGGYSPIDVV